MSSNEEEANRQSTGDIIEDIIESLSSSKLAFRSFEDLNLTTNENLQSIAIGLVSGGSESSRSSSTIGDGEDNRLVENSETANTNKSPRDLYGNSKSTDSEKEKVSSSGISSVSSSDSSEEENKSRRNKQNEREKQSDEELRMLRYELKEKDLDIVQLQKEINELQLENKMLKLRSAPLGEVDHCLINLREDEFKSLDLSSPYLKEILVLKREKECVAQELTKAQDTIARLNFEKSTKGIDLYDPNSPEILNKKIRALEKQIHDLEEENEKHINEYSKMEKTLDKLKMDNSDLKQRVNEGLLHKEREESLRLENINLKNQLGRIGITNNQLMSENQQLINSFNSSKISPFIEGKSVSTQTSVQFLDEDESDSLNRVRFHAHQFLTPPQYKQLHKTYEPNYNNYTEEPINRYTLSRNDDSLIDNFRPFSSDKSIGGENEIKKQPPTLYSYDNQELNRTKNPINSYPYYSKSNSNVNLIGTASSFVGSNRIGGDFPTSGARYHQPHHHKQPIYSSSGETLSTDEIEEPKQHRKSMKINVMRDLKSAQKLKSSLSKRYYESPPVADYEPTNKWTFKPRIESSSYQPATVKRSQTCYSSSTLPTRSSLSKFRADYYRMTEDENNNNRQTASKITNTMSSAASSTCSRGETTTSSSEGIMRNMFTIPRRYSYLYN